MEPRPDCGALIDGRTGEAAAPAELARRVERRRAALAKEGVGAGDRVAVTHGNSADFFVDLLAVWALDACLVPLDPAMPAAELEHVLKHAKAQVLLGRDRSRRLGEPRGGATGEALVLYTSGTTAGPKGVVHTRESLAAKFAALSRHCDAASWGRAACLLPTFFGHGLICNSLWPWLGGKDLVIFPSNDLETLARLGEAVDRHGVEFMSTVPSIWRWILHSDVRPPGKRTLRRVHCASAPLDEALWRRACDWAGAPVINVFGTTETAGWIAGTEPGESPADGLVGTGWGCEFQVKDGKEGVGEIWVKTASLMRGYEGPPELTAAAVRDGWYRTGDLGSVDARGRVRVMSRADDVINKAGMKVFPDEVEAVLKSSGDVADACVFGEPHPIFGQDVAAAVVLRGGALARVRAWCEERLSAFKVPRTWYELKELPRGERGKVSRRRVAEICREKK